MGHVSSPKAREGKARRRGKVRRLLLVVFVASACILKDVAVLLRILERINHKAWIVAVVSVYSRAVSFCGVYFCTGRGFEQMT